MKLAQKPQGSSIIKKEIYGTWVLGFPDDEVVKYPPAMQETREMQVQCLDQEDLSE